MVIRTGSGAEDSDSEEVVTGKHHDIGQKTSEIGTEMLSSDADAKSVSAVDHSIKFGVVGVLSPDPLLPAPVDQSLPAPVDQSLPAPVHESLPVHENLPAPVDPVDESLPAPVHESLPVHENLPAPVDPVDENLPAPAHEDLPAPVDPVNENLPVPVDAHDEDEAPVIADADEAGADVDDDEGYTVVASRKFGMVRGRFPEGPYVAPPEHVCENEILWEPKSGSLRKTTQWSQARKGRYMNTPEGAAFFVHGSFGQNSLEY